MAFLQFKKFVVGGAPLNGRFSMSNYKRRTLVIVGFLAAGSLTLALHAQRGGQNLATRQ